MVYKKSLSNPMIIEKINNPEHVYVGFVICFKYNEITIFKPVSIRLNWIAIESSKTQNKNHTNGLKS